MSNLAYERLHTNLVKLKLNTVGTILDNSLEIAAKEGKTTLEVLDYLMDQEKHAKDTLSQETRMKLARFPVIKRFEDFDFEFQPSIDKAVITDLALLRFVYNAENVVFLVWGSLIWPSLLVLKQLKLVFLYILPMQESSLKD